MATLSLPRSFCSRRPPPRHASRRGNEKMPADGPGRAASATLPNLRAVVRPQHAGVAGRAGADPDVIRADYRRSEPLAAKAPSFGSAGGRPAKRASRVAAFGGQHDHNAPSTKRRRRRVASENVIVEEGFRIVIREPQVPMPSGVDRLVDGTPRRADAEGAPCADRWRRCRESRAPRRRGSAASATCARRRWCAPLCLWCRSPRPPRCSPRSRRESGPARRPARRSRASRGSPASTAPAWRLVAPAPRRPTLSMRIARPPHSLLLPLN